MVDNLINALSTISFMEYLLAALGAFLITNIILEFVSIKKGILLSRSRFEYQKIDLTKVMEKCRLLFPIDTFNFGGKTFKSGMFIRITTMQKKVIEGELIGKNNSDMLCIVTPNNIVAHEIDKIQCMEETAVKEATEKEDNN